MGYGNIQNCPICGTREDVDGSDQWYCPECNLPMPKEPVK